MYCVGLGDPRKNLRGKGLGQIRPKNSPQVSSSPFTKTAVHKSSSPAKMRFRSSKLLLFPRRRTLHYLHNRQRFLTSLFTKKLHQAAQARASSHSSGSGSGGTSSQGYLSVTYPASSDPTLSDHICFTFQAVLM